MKYEIGQFVGLKMSDGSYRLSRILDIYEPGETKMFCGREYTNNDIDATFHIEAIGIMTPKFFFESKLEADNWLLKMELESVKKQFEEEQQAHIRTKDKIRLIKKIFSNI